MASYSYVSDVWGPNFLNMEDSMISKKSEKNETKIKEHFTQLLKKTEKGEKHASTNNSPDFMFALGIGIVAILLTDAVVQKSHRSRN